MSDEAQIIEQVAGIIRDNDYTETLWESIADDHRRLAWEACLTLAGRIVDDLGLHAERVTDPYDGHQYDIITSPPRQVTDRQEDTQ